MIESADAKEIVSKTSSDLLNKNIIKRYSSCTSLGAVFAEKFNRNIRDLLEKLVLQSGTSDWVDMLSTITEQNINRNHSSTKTTPIDASFKKNEGYVYKNLLDKRKKTKP